MASCPRCEESVDPAHRFCEGCGTDQWVRRGGTSTATGSDAPCTDCDEPAAAASGSGYCPVCGLRRPDGTEHVDTDLGALAGVSDRGHVHTRNEDAMELGWLAAPDPAGVVMAAVVCDGVSTVRTPELASRTAAAAALDVLLGARSGTARDRTRDAVTGAADRVAALPGADGRDAPSCTLVSAFVTWPGDGAAEITVGWVGDSRAYWLAAVDGADPAGLLTTDHSWAVQMVAIGAMDEATAMADRRAHAITRWLGGGGEPGDDVVALRPDGPGVLLLCSDGLWNYLPDAAELAAVVLPAIEAGSAIGAATALTRIALDAGGRDNVTVVAIPIDTRSPS